MQDMSETKKISVPLQKYVDLIHELGGGTMFPIWAARQVKGDQLLEDESMDWRDRFLTPRADRHVRPLQTMA